MSIRGGVLLLLALLAWPVSAGVVAEVQIAGVSDELQRNIRALLSIERKGRDPGLTREQLKKLHLKAVDEIRTALQPFGFYSPTIEPSLTAPAYPQLPWIAHYQIEPGSPVRIERLELRILGAGAEEGGWQELAELEAIGEGQILRHPAYERGKRRLLEFIRDRGYLDAEYQMSRVEVEREAHRAVVHLHLKSGPRYRFGEALFEQIPAESRSFDEDFLRRYLTLQPGDPLTTAEISTLRRALAGSGYFSGVGLNLLEDQIDELHQVPLEIRLTPFRPNQYRARIGYGTDSGVGLRLDWKRRYLGQEGHAFNLGGVMVQERRKLILDFKYQIPLKPLERSRVELTARHEAKDLGYDDFGFESGDQTRLSSQFVEMRLHHPRKLGGVLVEESIGIGYLTDRYNLFNLLWGDWSAEEQQFVAQFIDQEFGSEGLAMLSPSFRMVVPGIRWSYTRSDHPMYPSDGEQVQLDLRGAMEGFGSNTTFLQTDLRAKVIRPLFGGDRLITRGEIAYTRVESTDIWGLNLNHLPESFEYRTGGDTTVRGYPYESLIGEDALTGGKHRLVASIEYEKKILEAWSLATFYDVGNAFNDFSRMGLMAGAGVGARWYSPIGLVRFDFAFALDEPGTPWRIHFRVGPEF